MGVCAGAIGTASRIASGSVAVVVVVSSASLRLLRWLCRLGAWSCCRAVIPARPHMSGERILVVAYVYHRTMRISVDCRMVAARAAASARCMGQQQLQQRTVTKLRCAAGGASLLAYRLRCRAAGHNAACSLHVHIPQHSISMTPWHSIVTSARNDTANRNTTYS